MMYAKMRERIGFMQGRLVGKVNGKIQAFPSVQWRDEFPAAQALGLQWVEWTLDAEELTDNPLCTPQGRSEIQQLSAHYGVRVASITGDCFMQNPFWKADSAELECGLRDLDLVLNSAGELGIRFVVIPLVDNGRLETSYQEAMLISNLLSRVDFLREKQLAIIFESDFSPLELARFIAQLPTDVFGINYDIGNSASLGFDPTQEIAAYGPVSATFT